MAILKFILIFLEVLLLFNLLIFVHELGHFLAAKWRGLKIDRFAIWFGKPIWKKKINGVEYAMGTIPAGGYVSLPQMATMEMIEGKGESSGQPLPPISPLDKIIVAFAGPLFSFLLALSFAVVVWAIGRPVSKEDDSTTIGWVDPSGPGWKAGLRPGDKIVEIDNHPVTHFGGPAQDSITWRIITSEGTNIALKYLRGDQEYMAYAVPTHRKTKWYERKDLRHVMIGPVQKAVIYKVATNSPAALAGLQRGDEIVAINGEKIYSFASVLQIEDSMTNGPIEPVTFTVRRCDEQFDRIFQPERPIKPAQSPPSFGILGWEGNTNMSLVYPRPFEIVRESAGQIFATIGTIFSHKSDVGVQQLGGTVMIMRLYANLFDSENGWRLVIWYSVMINVNLALLNMLPFPVLDGGHITLALIEAIRRRPVSARVLQYIQTGCAALLIGFMLYITFFDTGDWIRSARKNHEEPIVFAPKN
jgi:regulator of sigma E protease